MGVIIDIVLILIIILSAFLGYKKGLVKLGTKLIAGIVAIIITLIAYNGVSNFIIKNTQIDEKIESIVIENTTKVTEDNSIVNGVISNEQNTIAKWIVNVVIAIIIFIASKILVSLVISLLDIVAKLPILKQFNEIGGIIYGILRGIIIIVILIAILGVLAKVNPTMNINEKIENTHITKIVYNKIVKF